MELSFFAEMAWKSALIAGAALALAYALRSRAAADRALVLRIGVAMLLLLPLIALALPALPVAAWSAPAAAPALPPPAMPDYLRVTDFPPPTLAAADAQPAWPARWDDPAPLVLLAYLGGLALAGGRLLIGLILLRRWTRAATAVTRPEWLDALERVEGAHEARLLTAAAVPAPLSWGWRDPVILIDPATLDDAGEADAILAHEMAHIARGDWLALMLTRVAAALFWFNPLVWLLEREIVQQAEEAADCEAAAYVEPTRYAQTLLSWAQAGGRALPANSIAPRGSALGRRVKAILDGRTRERPSGSALTRIAVLACVVIAAPVAAMKLVQAAAPAAPEAPAAPASLQAPDAPPAPRAPAAPHAPTAPHAPMAVPDVPDVPAVPDVAPMVNRVLAEVLPQIPQIVASATAAIDPAEIDRATEEALRANHARMSAEEREHIRREVRRAVEQARGASVQARAEAMRARTEAMAAVRAAQPQIAAAMAEARRAPQIARAAMVQGAEGMMRGAEGMERGAREMEEQAARLRDPAFRASEIERARARGEHVTDAELLEAADGLRDGAEGMRDGAREMRESAARMRAGHDD